MMKLAKRNFTTLIAIFSVSVALQFFLPTVEDYSSVFNAVPEDKFKKEPGWYEQFYLMKKDENGKIPSGLHKQWNEQSQKLTLSKRETEVLADIENIGPVNVGGRTRALLIDKGNPNHILAGAISGGLWQSNDRGKNWQLIDDHSPNLNISCITQNPFQHNIFYYGTGEGAGNSSAAPGEGIFKSEDGGKTFTQLEATRIPVFEYIWDIKHSITDPNTFYVATRSHGLYKSVDAGISFERVFPANNAIHDIEVFPDGKVMFSLAGTGIFRSADGSAGSFTKVVDGLPVNGFNRIELAYCDSFSNVIYAQIGNFAGDALLGLYRSDDSGSTWVLRENKDTRAVVSYKFVWYCYTLYVKPNNPDAIVSGCVTAGYSQDGGHTWQAIKESHADYHTIIPDPANPEKYFIGNDGGVYSYSWDAHNFTFEDLNHGYISTQFYTGAYFPTGLDIIGGTQDNGTHMTRAGKAEFKKLFGGDGSFTQVNQQNPAIAYVSTQNGLIRKTTNVNSANPVFQMVTGSMATTPNGNNIQDAAWFINPFEINLKNGEELYFVTRKRVYRTSNGAASWAPITNIMSTALSPYAIGISNDVVPTVYIGGQNAMFKRLDEASSAVAGKEVELRNSVPIGVKSSFISNIKVHPNDPSVLYACFSNYSSEPRIFKVTEANTDKPIWTSIGGNLPSMLPVNWVEADPLNPDSILFAGTDFGLYYTIDGGKNWVKEKAIPNVVIDMIKLRPSDGMLFIFTHGRGVWKAQVVTQTGPAAIAKTNNNLKVSVYPNPAQDFIRLEFNDNDKANHTGSGQHITEVYSLSGKLMLKQTLNTSQASMLDIKALPAGTYLLRVSNGNKEYTAKVLKTNN